MATIGASAPDRPQWVECGQHQFGGERLQRFDPLRDGLPRPYAFDIILKGERANTLGNEYLDAIAVL